jgi:hypothetical protein
MEEGSENVGVYVYPGWGKEWGRSYGVERSTKDNPRNRGSSNYGAGDPGIVCIHFVCVLDLPSPFSHSLPGFFLMVSLICQSRVKSLNPLLLLELLLLRCKVDLCYLWSWALHNWADIYLSYVV